MAGKVRMGDERGKDERTYNPEDEFEMVKIGAASQVSAIGIRVTSKNEQKRFRGLRIQNDRAFANDNGLHVIYGKNNGFSAIASMPVGLQAAGFRIVDAYRRAEGKYYHYYFFFALAEKEYEEWDVPEGTEELLQEFLGARIGILDIWLNDKTNNPFLQGTEKIAMLNFWGLIANPDDKRREFLVVDSTIRRVLV